MAATLDLGEIDRPLLVCGGAYGNLEALEALLSEAARLSIGPDRIIHTGDIIAYCADPEATAQLARRSGILAIKGNVEAQLAAGEADCGCGFEQGSQCDALAARWYAHADAHISPAVRGWMAALPDHIVFTMAGRRWRVVHGAPTGISRYMFASLDAAAFRAEIAAAGADGVIAGHTGLPFTRRIGGAVWHNPGAIGMPANDASTRGWYSLLRPVDRGVLIDHRPLDYDHTAAAAKVRALGLAVPYAAALESGLWPSLDILPDAERAATGQPLQLPPVTAARLAAPAA